MPRPKRDGTQSGALGGEVEDYELTIGAAAGAPSAPVLSLTQNFNQMTFSWTPGSNVFGPPDRAPATTFRIDAYLTSPPAAAAASIPVDGSQTSFTTTAPDGRYFVTVTGINEFGESPPSNVVDATVPAGGAPCSTQPDAPTGLTAQLAGNIVTFNWTASTGCPATTYVLRAGSAPGTSNIAPGVNTGGTNPMVLVSTPPSGRYYVRVAGRNANGDSADSNEVMLDVP